MKSFLIADILGLKEEIFESKEPVRLSEKSTNLIESKPSQPQVTPSDLIDLHPFVCRICDKKFKEEHQLVYHSRLHDRNKCCPICNEFFRSKSKFKAHLRTGHSKIQRPQPAIKCELCDKRFRDRLTLMKHKAKYHPSENQFEQQLSPRLPPLDLPRTESDFKQGNLVNDSPSPDSDCSSASTASTSSDISDPPVFLEPSIQNFPSSSKSYFIKRKFLQRYNESIQTSM